MNKVLCKYKTVMADGRGGLRINFECRIYLRSKARMDVVQLEVREK
jgi:hypothetical protein